MYDHQNFLGECVNTFKTFVTSVFLCLTWKCLKSIFSKPVSIFSCSSRALIIKYNRMTRFSLKNGSSLRLMENNLFYPSYDVTFFRAHSPECLKHFRYVYGCRMMHRKNLKATEIENFTRTSEISDSVLSTLWNSLRVWTRADFLKLEFSILIILLPNIFGELFECIQNFCPRRFLDIKLENLKNQFFRSLVAFFHTIHEH